MAEEPETSVTKSSTTPPEIPPTAPPAAPAVPTEMSPGTSAAEPEQEPEQTQQPEAAETGFYRGNGDADNSPDSGSDEAGALGATDQQGPDEVSWMASEFIHHDKSVGWYLSLVLVAAAAAAVIYLLTKDVVSIIVVAFAAFFLAYFGSHKPRQLEYKIDSKGVTVGGKFYSYQNFRSFSVVPEGAFNSIVFMPLKRFAVPLSIYYDPQAETSIIDVLKEQLPFEPGRLDVSERLVRKIRF